MLSYDVRYFLARVAELDGCVLWTGSVLHNGYPVMHLRVPGGKRHMAAHRWLWEHMNGPLADGIDVDHVCHVKLCVNPAHLRAIPRAVNRGEGFTYHARRAARDAALIVPEPLSGLMRHAEDGQGRLW